MAINRVLNIASAEVGVREIGNTNRGRRVDEYQRADNLPGVGYAWCASFVGWCMLTALGQSLCDRVWLRSASCDAILDWGRRRGIINTAPAAGSAGLVMASKNDATHIFLVSKTTAQGVGTVEGNTNDSGSRNGNGVYARFRNHSSRYLYVHWARLLPAKHSLPDGTFVINGQPQPKNPLADLQHWELFLGGKKAADVPLIDGHSYVPAWKWAHWFRQELVWNPALQSVSLNGIEVASQPRLIPDEAGNNRAWLQVTKLAAATRQKDGSPLKVGSEPGKVLVTR